ncbi:helix-turn-helix domain-containing protein [Amycolatopsis sp. GM8]|uniref:helix-turn-helix domain-containing protein n=1 Tax=Amycolatopsis sp. GM8 TaxID=2896530 RepID=UPI001F37CCBD|nr:helix-turn-helix domain-containing protein [Amycolatopsis sp. GM8]
MFATIQGLDMAGRDARGISAEALEELRRRAVAAVEAGGTRAEVARLLGVSRKTVGAWVSSYQRLGDDAFRPKRRGRRPGEQYALSPAQQAWTVRTIVDGSPDRHGLPHRLWNRQAIAELINREFGVLISAATISQYLSRWGLIEESRLLELMRGRVTAVVPRQRTPARGDEWLDDAEALWLAWTRPRRPPDAGRGPVATGQNLMTGFRDYFGDVNVLLAMSRRGMVFFQAQRGPFDADQAADFLQRLMAQFGRGLNVVVCAWPLEHYEVLGLSSHGHPGRVAFRFTLG